MKTLQQWWAERSPLEIACITEYCPWLDIDQPSGLVHKEITNISKSEFLDEDTDNSMLTRILLEAILTKNNAGEYRMFDNASESERQNLLLHALMCYSSSVHKETMYKYLDTEHMLTYLDQYKVPKLGIERLLFEALIKTEDKDNIEWENLIYKSLVEEGSDLWRYHIPGNLITLIPADIIIKIAKDKSYCFYDWDELPVNSDLFDEVFFCQDGVSKQSKRFMIERLLRRAGMDDKLGRKRLDEFLERVVSVNKRYLKCLNEYLDSSDFNQIYTRYKTEIDPATGAEVVPEQKSKRVHYYGEEIRQFAMIAASCKHHRVFGGRIKGCGDAAGLLAMYHYNFDTITDMMYPADPDNPCYFDMP